MATSRSSIDYPDPAQSSAPELRVGQSRPSGGRCRFCAAELRRVVTDLGMSPPCESFLTAAELDRMEPFYPLVVWVCDECWLMQVPDQIRPEDTFVEYGYFSSFSDHWLAHCRADAHAQIRRWALGPASLVVEVGSNDGYFLRWFVEQGIPVLGIDPAANVALAAEDRGVSTVTEFFGTPLAERLKANGQLADLLVGKNVLAQVPDLNDFVAGLKDLLGPTGVIAIEFPHLQRLIDGNQFDTIYHEHFSYFSLYTVEKIFAAHGITIFDVEELWTHGGSLRVYGRHTDDPGKPVTDRVDDLRRREIELGYASPRAYAAFDEGVRRTRRELLKCLIELHEAGQRVVGYGAAGKGMTLLNYCGIRADLLEFVADRNPYKQGRFCPGVHIPVLPPEAISQIKPDVVLILPWNLRDEICAQLSFVRDWGGRFLIPIPTPEMIA